MNLRQLEAFRATFRCGSITKASEMMRISQPSVSRLIADLEHSVGFDLFTRIGRGLTPTIEGQRFYDGVEGMFVGIDRLEDLAKSIKSSQKGTISIATIQSISAIELPHAISQVYKSNPEIRFNVQSRNTPGIIDAVQMRQVDLGIIGRAPENDGVEVLYQTSVPYVCLMPEDHPLATEFGAVDLNKIVETEQFVTFGDLYPDTMLSIDPKLSERLQARSRLTIANMSLAGTLVRETSVLAVADPFSAEPAVRMGGLVFRPVKQKLTYGVALIAANRESLSRETLGFVDLFADQMDKRSAELRSLHGA